MALNDNPVPGSITEAKGCAIPGHHIALEILMGTATNDVLQTEGRQGRATWHRVKKLLCRQRARFRCKRLAGWEIHTLELLSWPLSQPQRKGCSLWVHPLLTCITDSSEELLPQGCAGQHAQWLLPRDVGLTRGDSWVLCNNCLPFHTPSRAPEPVTGQTSAGLCQGLNKSQAAVSSKVSLQLYAKMWMQVCSMLLLKSTLTHFSGGRKSSQNQSKTKKER